MHQHRPSVPSRSTARSEIASPLHCFQAAFPVLVGLVLALATSRASAIGPDLPLEFREVEQGIELVLDPAHIARVDAQRSLHDHGRLLREQRLDLSPERRTDSTAVATVPLQLEQFSDLPPGYYALKLVAVGEPSNPESRAVPLRIERWVFFAVDRTGVRRVSDEEYSAAIDPAELDHGDRGEQILLHKGGSREGQVRLENTERGQALPLGRSGAAIEEPGSQGRPGEAATPRRDERQER
jgi:hypothetical protein